MATITKTQGSQVGIAFGFAALCSAAIAAAFPFLFADADLASVMVFWSVLFTFSGVLTGLNLEITRSVAAETPAEIPAETPAEPPNPASGLKAVWVAGAIGLTIAALLAITAPWWGTLPFPTHGIGLALAVALGVVGCGFYHGVGGSLAGSGRWTTYAGLVSADSGLRLLLVFLTAILTRSVVATAVGAAAAFLVWALFLTFSANTRAASRVKIQVPLKILLARFAAAALASGASAVLVIGFPALLSLTTDAEVIRTTAPPLILALTLTRAPLMIPLNAAQGVVISHFAQSQNQGLKALWPVLRIALAIGAVAVAAAASLGPWLLNTIWGPDFVLSGIVLGALTAGATGLALITLTGAICQSLTLHQSFVGGWLAAVATAIVVLLLPGALAARAALALIIGPLVGTVVHLLALRRHSLPTKEQLP